MMRKSKISLMHTSQVRIMTVTGQSAYLVGNSISAENSVMYLVACGLDTGDGRNHISENVGPTDQFSEIAGNVQPSLLSA